MDSITFPRLDPTPKTVPSPPSAADAVAAIVFREILKPLAAGLGPLGEMAAASVADRLFLARRQ